MSERRVFVVLGTFGVPQDWGVMAVYESGLDALGFLAGEVAWSANPDDPGAFWGDRIGHEFEHYQIVPRALL